MLKLWTKISYAGVKSEMGYETKRRIILLNRIATLLFLIVFTLRTVVISLGFQNLSMDSLGPYFSMLAIFLIPFLNVKGYYKASALIFSIITPVAFLFFGIISQNSIEVVNINHYYLPRLFILACIVIPLILIDTKNKIHLSIAITVNFMCIIFFDNAIKILGVPLNPSEVDFNNYSSISIVMLLPAILMVMAFLFLANLNKKYESQIIGLNINLKQRNRDLSKQKNIITSKNSELEQFNEEIISQRDLIAQKSDELENAKHKIELINKQLMDSISYAKDIQKAVLDKEELPGGYFHDSFIFYKPKSHVSGDFYLYKQLNINNKNCLIVTAVDCTGHGVPGGFLSMLGITLLNEILHNNTIENAASVLSKLREKIKITLNQTGKFTEQKDGMDMALCIFYPDTKEMEYAGARLPLCIINKSNEMQIIKADRQPIGVFLKEKDFTNHHIKLNEGEMVYIFSDGIQDQFGGPIGNKLKFRGLQELLKSISQKTCPDQKSHIASFINEWIHADKARVFEQIDDIVMIGMKV